MQKRLVQIGVIVFILVLCPPVPPTIGASPDPQTTPHLPLAPIIHHSHEGPLPAYLRSTTGCETPSQNPAVLGVTPLSILDTGLCRNADIDVYQAGEQLIVAQAGYNEAAFTLSDVTDPVHPTILSQFVWGENYGSANAGAYTATLDVKHFINAGRHYLALALERFSITGYCGVALVDVTDPIQPTFVRQIFGEDWCDVHNTFVDQDNAGNGTYLYLTANSTRDLRVLDIRDLNHITEVGRYTHPDAGRSVYVHDVTVVDGRVYVAYWNAGLIILNAADLTPGTDPTPLNPPSSIQPSFFKVHHAYPTADGNYVFIQDEMTTGEPVRMYDIRNLKNPVVVDAVSVPGTLAHNLHVMDRLLLVGWYEAGLQGFEITTPAPATNPFALTPVATPTGLTRVLYHAVRDNPGARHNGAWGVRTHACKVGGIERTCIFTSDMKIGLIVDMLREPHRCHPADHDCDDDVDLTDLQIQASHWRDPAPSNSRFDLDKDGDSDVVDIQRVILARGWPLAP